MISGMVFGKFMPLHNGHLALIEYSLKHCDRLYVLLCYTDDEPIDFAIRKRWLLMALDKYPSVNLICFEYDPNDLSNSSVSSRSVSEKWAKAFKNIVPEIDLVITSEPYGEYVAEFMGVNYLLFDEKRKKVPISAAQIREKPFRYWNYIPGFVQPWFVKKVCIAGTESTGKSTLTIRLAKEFSTNYVSETARDIVETTENCTFADLQKIAELHAKTIIEKQQSANKILFVDTDLIITKSYSRFLFGKELKVPQWIEDANRFDLHLFLEPDCLFVQDGTRLTIHDRSSLSDHHKYYLTTENVNFISMGGDWENRFRRSYEIVNAAFASLM